MPTRTPRKDERQAKLFQLKVISRPPGRRVQGTDVDLSQVIEALKQAVDKRQAEADINELVGTKGKKRKPIRLLKITELPADEAYVALLFSVGDPDATDTTKEHIPTRKRETLQMNNGDVQLYGAHLVIRTTQRGNAMYRCALEDMPHVGRDVVIRFLENLIHRHLKHEPPLQYRDPKTHKWLACEVALRGYPEKSEELLKELREGQIVGVEFYREDAIDDADDEEIQSLPYVEKVEIKLKQEIKSYDERVGMLKRLYEYAFKRDFSKMTPRIRDADDEEHRRPIPIKGDEADFKDALYTKYVDIPNEGKEFKSEYDRVDKKMFSSLVEIVGNNKNWRSR